MDVEIRLCPRVCGVSNRNRFYVFLTIVQRRFGSRQPYTGANMDSCGLLIFATGLKKTIFSYLGTISMDTAVRIIAFETNSKINSPNGLQLANNHTRSCRLFSLQFNKEKNWLLRVGIGQPSPTLGLLLSVDLRTWNLFQNPFVLGANQQILDQPLVNIENNMFSEHHSRLPLYALLSRPNCLQIYSTNDDPKLLGYLQSGRLLLRFHPNWPVIATDNVAGTCVHFFDVKGEGCSCLLTLKTWRSKHNNYNRSWAAAFHSTNPLYVTGNTDGYINGYDIKDLYNTSVQHASLLWRVRAHDVYVTDIVFFSSNIIVTASTQPKTCVFWLPL